MLLLVEFTPTKKTKEVPTPALQALTRHEVAPVCFLCVDPAVWALHKFQVVAAAHVRLHLGLGLAGESDVRGSVALGTH